MISIDPLPQVSAVVDASVSRELADRNGDVRTEKEHRVCPELSPEVPRSRSWQLLVEEKRQGAATRTGRDRQDDQWICV
jgi:hypothetical protein